MRITTQSLTLYLFMVIALTSVLFGIVSAQAAPMTDEQIGRIRTSCVSAKNTLNQLHAQ